MGRNDETINWLEGLAASMEGAEPESHGEAHDKKEEA